MLKKIMSIVLCLFLLLPVIAGCSNEVNPEDKGAYLYMYLTDTKFNYDPAYAYQNESALKVISLLFDNLFVLDSNGKVQKSLVKSYKINENEQANEYEMIITLKETYWTDKVQLTANDIVFAWKRIINPRNASEAACLLMDIKNAHTIANELAEDVSIDDLGIYAINETQLQIFFEKKIDYDQFILNLTSYALVPLREEIVVKNEDWAKKPATICSSGPFKLRKVSFFEGLEELVLERNSYYFRDDSEDALDKSVTPYRIIIDYTKTDEQIKQAYENGEIFYIGDIPMSLRGAYKDVAEVTDALSTHTYVLNQNAIVRYYKDSEQLASLSSSKSVYDSKLVEGEDGEKILANADVRNALSLAIDRDAIANAVVFAKAATGLVPYGVFDTTRKTSFRTVGGDIISTSKKLSEAETLITKSGIDPKKFVLVISVPAYDDVHKLIAENVKAAWEALGFNVALNAIDVIINNDTLATTNSIAKDIKDDVFLENYNTGKFEIAAIDYTALSANPFATLALFAKGFSGNAIPSNTVYDDNFAGAIHITGYDSKNFNDKIMAAHKEQNLATIASLLHDAENILLEDMPVIPIIFNQNATLTNNKLSKIIINYYGVADFSKTKLKDYLLYIPTESTVAS